MQTKFFAYLTTSLVAFTTSVALAQPAPIIVTATGDKADDIRPVVDQYRATLGAPLNAPGPTGDAAGRREINWDAVPDQFAAPNNLPPDFFNRNSVRGAVFSSNAPGWVGFQVSSNASAGPVRFENLHAGYASLFTVFSEQKLFTSTGSNVYDVDFFAPGTTDKAVVNGFGAIFTNVAIPFTSTLEFYSAEGVLLGKYSARVAPKGLSFLGVVFPNKMVAKVRVTQGTAVIGETDDPANGRNVVALDDFFYGEPTAVNACAK